MNNKFSVIGKENVHKDVSHNISVSMLCTFIQLVTRFFIPPIVLSYVSIEEYGIWAYCFIFVGYFGMSVIGITNVYVRYSAIYYAKKQVDKINCMLSTGVMCTGLISLLAILGAWSFLPYSFPILQIPPELRQTAFTLIFGTMAVFSLELSVGFFNYLLHGLQKVGLQRIILTVTHLTETVFIVLFLHFGFGIISLLYAFLIRISLSVFLSGIACYSILPGLSIHPKFFDFSMIKIFYGYGGIIQLRSMVGILNRMMEKLLAGIFIGTQATALFELGCKFPINVMAIPKTANAVFLPITSRFHAKGENDEIRKLYLGGSRYISIITGFFMGFLAPFSFILMTAWLGTDPKFQTAALILTCFALPYHFEVVTGPASAVFRSINKPSIELGYGVAELVLAVTTVAISFYYFGATVMVINLSVGSMMLTAVFIYLFYSNVYLGIKHSTFFRTVVVPGLIPYLLALFIAGISYNVSDHLYTNRWMALGVLFVSWIAYICLSLPILYFAVLNIEERKHLYDHYFQKLFKKKKEEVKTSSTLCPSLVERIWNERMHKRN